MVFAECEVTVGTPFRGVNLFSAVIAYAHDISSDWLRFLKFYHVLFYVLFLVFADSYIMGGVSIPLSGIF